MAAADATEVVPPSVSYTKITLSTRADGKSQLPMRSGKYSSTPHPPRNGRKRSTQLASNRPQISAALFKKEPLAAHQLDGSLPSAVGGHVLYRFVFVAAHLGIGRIGGAFSGACLHYFPRLWAWLFL